MTFPLALSSLPFSGVELGLSIDQKTFLLSHCLYISEKPYVLQKSCSENKASGEKRVRTLFIILYFCNQYNAKLIMIKKTVAQLNLHVYLHPKSFSLTLRYIGPKEHLLLREIIFS